jgi:hypothetical protein
LRIIEPDRDQFKNSLPLLDHSKFKVMLSEEIKFFNNNQAILARWYPYNFIVIKGNQVYGGFQSILEAYASALKRFEIGTFLVIKTRQKFCLNREQKLPVKSSWAANFLIRLFQSHPN